MVNFGRMRQLAKQRALRGLYTGVGAVLSGATGNFLSERIDSEVGVDVAQIVVGNVASIGVGGVSGPGQMLDESGFVSEAIEFAGYGIQGAGWDELAEDMDLGLDVGGSQSERVVDVTSEARAQTDGGSSATPDEAQADTFLADVG